MSIKPKLRSSSKILDISDEIRPALQNSNPLVSYETLGWKPIIIGWAKSVALFLLGAIILALLLYAGLSATIAYTVNLDGHREIVARDTFVGNEITKNSIVYGSMDSKLENTILSKLLEGGNGLIGNEAVSNGVVVKVLAGPTMKISLNSKGNIIIESGKNKGDVITDEIDGSIPSDGIISEKYIVECKWGACDPGTYFFLSADNISGKVISPNEKRG